MKLHRISLIVVLTGFLIVFVSSGVISALNPDQASVRGFNSNPNPQPGETIQITVFFQNNSTDSLRLTDVGLHFDWMPNNNFMGFNLTTLNIVVDAGSDFVYPQPISVKVPDSASAGAHSYFIEIGGIEQATGNPFIIDSVEQQLVVADVGQTTSPTPTQAGGNGQPSDSNDFLLYGGIIAVVLVVVLLLVIILIRRKRRPAHKPTESTTNQPPPTQPEQKPQGQDFSI